MSRIVFATDLHLADGHEGLEAFAGDLQEICALAPDLLVVGGDICLWDEGIGDRFQALLRDLPFDTTYLMGNHDTDRSGHGEEFDHDFVSRFGSRNSCVQFADIQMVCLNTCGLPPPFDDGTKVRAAVGDGDLAWLDATLAGLDRALPLLLFVHIPLATTCPERRGADRETTDVWRVTNAGAIHQRLTNWPAPVVVAQGHLHENEHLHRDGIHYITVGSVCGRWWDHGTASRCTDGSPRGWLLVDVEEGDVCLNYQVAGIGAHWRGEIVPGGDDGGPRLSLFFSDPAEPVEVQINGEWITLPPPRPFAVDDEFFSTHHWALPPGFTNDSLQVRTRLRRQRWEATVAWRPTAC